MKLFNTHCRNCQGLSKVFVVLYQCLILKTYKKDLKQNLWLIICLYVVCYNVHGLSLFICPFYCQLFSCYCFVFYHYMTNKDFQTKLSSKLLSYFFCFCNLKPSKTVTEEIAENNETHTYGCNKTRDNTEWAKSLQSYTKQLQTFGQL